MTAAIVGIVGVVAGASLGYLLRLREWLREQRLTIYGDFIGSFLGLVEASMRVVSLYISFGDEMLTKPEWRDASLPALNEAHARRNAFDLATAKVHLISDESTFKAATGVEAFVLQRIATLPPYHNRDANALDGIETVRTDSLRELGEFLRSASKHAGVKPRGAKAEGLGVLATEREV